MPTRESDMAPCWVLAPVETSRPRERQVIMYMMLTAYNRRRLPLIGKSNAYTLRIRITVKLMIERTRYGTALARITKMGLKGDTSNTSMVPNSFSRTMEMDVIITHTSNIT